MPDLIVPSDRQEDGGAGSLAPIRLWSPVEILTRSWRGADVDRREDGGAESLAPVLRRGFTPP